MKREFKKDFVSKLTNDLSGTSAHVLVDYAGLSVQMQQDLKAQLRTVGATMTVVKNTLFKIASENNKAPKEIYEDTILQGPTALIFTKEDPIAPLQILGKFAKANEIPQFKAGVIEGTFQDKSGLLKLSKLPSKNELVAQALGSIAAPLYAFVGTLNAPMQQLVYVLQAKIDKDNK